MANATTLRFLLAASLLGGCVAAAVPGPVDLGGERVVRASGAPTVPGVVPAVVASAAIPVPGVVPDGPALLQRPGSGVLAVKGRVSVDANHLIGKIRAAQLISDKGGKIVQVGAPLISNSGGTVIANNGAHLIGKIRVADDNAGLIGKIRYGVAQVTTVPLGTVLPASGMVVTARSLATDSLMALGNDADGKPVYAVFTGADGAFEVYLPEAEKGNVLFEARPPESEASPAPADESLAYRALSAPTATGERAIDVDSTLVVAYMRLALGSRFAHLLTHDVNESLGVISDGLPVGEGVLDLIAGQYAGLHEAASTAGVDKAPDAASNALGLRCTEIALSVMDLNGLLIDQTSYVRWTGHAPEPAIATLVGEMRFLREAAGERLLANPDFFEGKDYIVAANACKAPADHYRITRPGDVGDYLVREHLVPVGIGRVAGTFDLWRDVTGIEPPPPGKLSHFDRFVGSIAAITKDMLQGTITNRQGSKDDTLAVIRAFTPEKPVPGDGPLPALPPSPCPLKAQ